MPITRSRLQRHTTLEAFYSGESREGCIQMLAFIARIGELLPDTMLYGLTSLYQLQLSDKDEDLFHDLVHVANAGEDIFYMEYRMQQDTGAWKDAWIKGEAAGIDAALDYLVIAMHNSGGWSNSRELRKLYNKLMHYEADPGFTLWLEFEAVDPGNWDLRNECCNIHVTLEDGRSYGLNVWTYKFLQTAIANCHRTGENLAGRYMLPPDLFVQELTRNCIEQAVADLLRKGPPEQVLGKQV